MFLWFDILDTDAAFRGVLNAWITTVYPFFLFCFYSVGSKCIEKAYRTVAVILLFLACKNNVDTVFLVILETSGPFGESTYIIKCKSLLRTVLNSVLGHRVTDAVNRHCYWS